MGLYKMISESLIGRLGEHSLFSQVRGETAAGLGNDIQSGLGKLAQGDSAAPSQGRAVVNTSHHQELLGHSG